MIESTYKPEDVKKRIRNSRGNISVIRKYHMTEKEMRVAKERWEKEIELDKIDDKYMIRIIQIRRWLWT